MKCYILSCCILLVLLYGHLHQVVGELRLPLIIKGPIGSNEINGGLEFVSEDTNKINSEPRPIIENIDIKSNITKHFEKTVVKFFVKNPSIRNAQEIAFTIELPYNNYHISNMTLQLLGDKNIYLGQNRNEEEVDALYKRVSKRGESAVVIKEIEKNSLKSYNEARMLSMGTHIPPGEKILLTLEYGGPLMKSENNTWNHVLHVNPHQAVENFNVNIYINETLPIVDPQAYEVRQLWPVFKYSSNTLKYDSPEYLHVSFSPKESGKDSVDAGYDMSGQFYTTYSLNKNYLLSKVGQDIMEITSTEEYEKMVHDIMLGVDFIFSTLLMVPFIILTEIVNGVFLIINTVLGMDTDWYLTQKQWYELEYEKEVAKLEKWKVGELDLPHPFSQKNPFLDTSKLPRINNWPSSISGHVSFSGPMLEDFSLNPFDYF
jgi:hypothetical protein